RKQWCLEGTVLVRVCSPPAKSSTRQLSPTGVERPSQNKQKTHERQPDSAPDSAFFGGFAPGPGPCRGRLAVAAPERQGSDLGRPGSSRGRRVEQDRAKVMALRRARRGR